MTKKVLISITSYNEPFYADGKKTGLCVGQAIQPFKVYRRKGYEVDIVSETGTFGIDEYSLLYEFLNGEDLMMFYDEASEFNLAMKNLKKATEINPEEYLIFYGTCGYGCLYDYAGSQISKIAAKIYQNGGVVATISHGLAIFDALIDEKTKSPLIAGKVITGFTDIGEKLCQTYGLLIEKRLPTITAIAKRNGAKYLSPCGPFDDFSITDGRIVTGANLKSAASTALRTLTVIRDLRLKHID